MTIAQKRTIAAAGEPDIPLARRLELIGLGSSTYHYKAKGIDAEAEKLMQLLDQHYTEFPH